LSLTVITKAIPYSSECDRLIFGTGFLFPSLVVCAMYHDVLHYQNHTGRAGTPNVPGYKRNFLKKMKITGPSRSLKGTGLRQMRRKPPIEYLPGEKSG